MRGPWSARSCKEDIVALVAAASLPVPTIALNSLPGDVPPFLFQYSLDPEQEARAVARRIASDGHIRGIALFPRNAWGERLQAAFADELRQTGVSLSAEQWYDPGASDFSGPLRAALGRYGGAGDRDAKGNVRPRDGAAEAHAGPQFAFIAAMPAAARALRPQLRFQMAYEMPVYATSDAWNAGSRAAPDLEGLRLPEMPWILYAGQGAPVLWEALQHEWASGRSRLRLYAFGFDAYQLLRGLDLAARGVAVDRTDGAAHDRAGWARPARIRLGPGAGRATAALGRALAAPGFRCALTARRCWDGAARISPVATSKRRACACSSAITAVAPAKLTW